MGPNTEHLHQTPEKAPTPVSPCATTILPPNQRPASCPLFTLRWLGRGSMGPISHSEVSSGRVEFGKRLVMGMAPIAMALISDTHPVSERRRAEGRGEVREKRGGTHATGKVHRWIL